MYEKFIKLKNNKPWLFWILIIPFVAIAALEFYNRYLVNSGKKIVEDAKKKDKDLKKKQDEANKKAKDHKKEADKLENEINNISIDNDWHKK